MHISLVVKLQWVFIVGLVAVIILQYSVIQRYEKNADEHVKIGAQSEHRIEELTNRPNCTASAMKIVNVPIVQSQQVKIPHGVAVTTFLGAPKWFQNRYSLMVNQVLTMLEDDWVVQILYDPSQKMALEGISYPGIQRQVRRGKVILTPIPTDMKKIKKNALLLTSWFWRSLVADNVLLFGGTAALCANTPFEVANFTHFDYIGAPWGGYSGQGGEGGVSIRNRATILKAVLELENHASTAQSSGNNGGGKEDAVLVRALLGMGAQVTVASKEDTLRFAANNNLASATALAVSGTLAGLSDDARQKFLDYCPEMKMMFPSLHNAACFGAEPNALECFRYLCITSRLRCGEKFKDISFEDGKNRKVSIHIELER